MKLPSVVFTLLALAPLTAMGCAAAPAADLGYEQSEIVNVQQTDVERQSIGNCWIYAHASWVESMNKAATGADFDISQSYWTYWHWFDQVVSGWSEKISTGGNWTTANAIIRKYGLMAEADFIDADTLAEMSSRQSSALSAMNAALKDGALKDSAARRDKALVRREMDKAWGLTPEASAMLDGVFGAGVERTFSSTASPASTEGSKIIRGQDFKVAYTTGPGKRAVERTLSQAMSEWRQVYYSSAERRQFLTRVQKALHDSQPVVITWFVDFNAMENRESPLRGSFNKTTLDELGPGRQGGHMTVLEDYQAKLADGTVLKAGVTLNPQNPEHKALLDRALEADTQIEFVRVKNSWGAARPDRAFAPGMPGYHDLYMDYLNGPVKRCNEKDGATDTTDCPYEHTPLQNVVVPPGY